MRNKKISDTWNPMFKYRTLPERNKYIRTLFFASARKTVLITILMTALSPFTTSDLFSQNNKGIALETGYARITGYYSSTFNAAPVFGIRVIPFESTYFFTDGILSFSSFQLKESYKSHFFVSGLDTGINARYNYQMFTPFIGAAIGGRYLYFNGKRSNESVQTFKPAAGFRLGTFIEFSEQFHITLRSDYMINSLSGKILSETMFTAGIMYRFGGSETSSRNIEPVEIDQYTEGMKALNSKNPVAARDHFLKVKKNDPLYPNALKIAEDISASIISYSEGKRLISENRKFDAIQYLEQAALYISDAVILLEGIRNELRKDILSLEKNGITAYDSKDYSLCIMIMRRILLIDPNNKTAKVYLPRAEKREEALRKLR